jgi:hypothetical protein
MQFNSKAGAPGYEHEKGSLLGIADRNGPKVGPRDLGFTIVKPNRQDPAPKNGSLLHCDSGAMKLLSRRKLI